MALKIITICYTTKDFDHSATVLAETKEDAKTMIKNSAEDEFEAFGRIIVSERNSEEPRILRDIAWRKLS